MGNSTLWRNKMLDKMLDLEEVFEAEIIPLEDTFAEQAQEVFEAILLAEACQSV